MLHFRPILTHVDESRGLDTVVAHLLRGGLLIYPTETSYAIGCDATNPAAVRAVFRAKGRDAGKSLPLIVASQAMAARYATLTPLARRLARQYWPGPLTIVCVGAGPRPCPSGLTIVCVGAGPRPRPSGLTIVCVGAGPRPRPSGRATTLRLRSGQARGRPYLPRGIVAPDGTIALRISSHPIARSLSKYLGRPIVSTSANRSGDPPACSARAAMRAFGDGGDMHVMDGGTLPRRAPSTIIDATGAAPHILRQGECMIPMIGSQDWESP